MQSYILRKFQKGPTSQLLVPTSTKWATIRHAAISQRGTVHCSVKLWSVGVLNNTWCMTALQISVLAGCSERVVYEVLQLHWVYYGQFTNHFTRESQQGSSSHPQQWRCWIHTHFVFKLIQHYIYLDELQEQNTTQLRCGRFQRLIRTNNCEVGPFWNFLKTYDCTNYCNAL